MLRINPLQPPRPFPVGITSAASPASPAGRAAFVAAEDYDATGIMAGVDPSESRYWWMPELYGPEPAESADGMPAATGRELQATRRTGAASAAAA